jgi:hypothetical protein
MTARLIRCRQLKREAETGIAHVYVPTTNGANCNGQWRRSRLTLLVKGPKYGDHLAQEAHSKSVPVITGHDVLDSLSRTGTPTEFLVQRHASQTVSLAAFFAGVLG